MTTIDMGKFTADKEETKPDWFHFGSEDLLGLIYVPICTSSPRHLKSGVLPPSPPPGLLY